MFSFLRYGLVFAIAASAQETTGSSSSSSGSLSVISGTATTSTGVTELATPTGDYVTYSSTLTMTTTSSAITTKAIVSEVTSGSSTFNTTLGSTTIFGIGTMTANVSGTATTSTSSQILLSGSSRTTASANGTSNSTATSTSSTAEATNTTPCNNYAEFCSLKYSNITEVSAHNSPFVKPGNAASNQELTVTTQLDDGIRLLQGQMHFVNSTPHFCHTSCDVLDAGPITDYLTTVYEWVSKHPYDVVTILLENGDYVPVTNYTSFIESTGLVDYAYVPPMIPMGIDDWPTLASMILTGKRVVFFMDYEANQTAVPWIIDEFSSMFETPFDPTDRTFPCTAQRPPGIENTNTSAGNLMYLVNHNLNYDINILGNSLLVPNIPLLNVTNANGTDYGTLGLSAQNCTETWGKPPKWLNVDYYNIGKGPNGNGSVFEVAAKYNNVTYDRSCCGLVESGAERMMQVVGRSGMVVAAAIFGVVWLSL